MAYQDRTPPVGINVDKEFFNILIQILVNNEKVKVDDTHKYAKELKEKLLKFSVPYSDEKDKKEMVRVRFYPNEASEMLWQLALGYVKLKPEADYHTVLLKLRESNKEEKREE